MSIDPPLSTVQKPALEFKSSAFNVPALILASHKITDIKQVLEGKISQAPEFFKNSPVLINLEEINKQHTDIDLRALIKTLRGLAFIPIAISSGNAKQNKIAIELGIAVQSVFTMMNLKNHDSAPATSVESIATPEPVVETATIDLIENKIVTVPVRSGQRIYTKGDLTVLAPVNPGAEIMAEGNIHVYAPLRGRASAGVQGNTQSCIFCSDLQAELVSIAGIYQLNEDLDKSLKRKLIQIYLHDQALLFKKL